jgi:hypothetical protein
MASFLSSVFSMFSGSGSRSPDGERTPAAPSASQVYNDCQIFAAPQKEGSQYRLAGRIEKQVDGETLVRTFIRADIFASLDDATETTFRKAQQIIDQNGPSLFSDGVPTRAV